MACQPPSGGCVLKRRIGCALRFPLCPAAFGRLCVETFQGRLTPELSRPAAFGRLCVETGKADDDALKIRAQPPSGGCVLKLAGIDESEESENQPPSGGCVLKPYNNGEFNKRGTSRLRAAVC